VELTGEVRGNNVRMSIRTERSRVAAGLALGLLVGVGVLPGAGAAHAAPADPPAKTGSKERPVAIVGEHVLTWSDLAPQLAEAAGGQVLEEITLGIVLKEECSRRGISIGDKEIKAERELLGQMLAQASHVPVSETELLIRNVRKARGLGDLRFRALLERNAQLRAMVREGIGDMPVTITPADIDTAYDLKYGPRVRARLILVRSQTSATQAKALIDGGRTFADVAAEVSIDPSSAKGGLLEPVSLQDTDYPVAVRKALETLKPGGISEPISVTWGDQSGFALIQVVENVPAPSDAPSREAATKELEMEVRVVRERAQMDKLARTLLKTAGVAVMDPSLSWSWEGRSK
jgi:parvulin-like peptidyl-prolyl isomerase